MLIDDCEDVVNNFKTDDAGCLSDAFEKHLIHMLRSVPDMKLVLCSREPLSYRGEVKISKAQVPTCAARTARNG